MWEWQSSIPIEKDNYRTSIDSFENPFKQIEVRENSSMSRSLPDCLYIIHVGMRLLISVFEGPAI